MSKYDLYLIYDDPVPYHNLLIHPIKMRKYLQFMTVAQILTLDKNSVPDANVISMSYLEYIIYSATDENFHGMFLDTLLHMVFNLEDDYKILYYQDKNKLPHFKIEDEDFNKNDFDEIRNIVIEQNALTPPDDTIQKVLRDRMEEANRLRRKISGNKTAGIEEQMIALSISTGILIENVYDMTIRKFMKSLERVDAKLHYQIYLQASLSGFVTFKDKSVVKHWLSDLGKDKLDGLIGYDEFEGKVAPAAG